MSPCPHGQGYANLLNFGIQVLRDEQGLGGRGEATVHQQRIDSV